MTDYAAPATPDSRHCCFFFDLDGTLADLQPSPEQVLVPPSIRASLACLHASGVPLAVVSGRRLSDLDRLLAPLILPAAGVHGAERRDSTGRIVRLEPDAGTLRRVGAVLARFCRQRAGLRLENKGTAFALHYRQAPEREGEARAFAEALARRHADLLTLQPGKCVYELKPQGASKGRAIEAFMACTPFKGRVPVFLGDDLTDEAGFQTVNRLGGLSIKVGHGPSAARWRLDSVAAVDRWLASVVATPDTSPSLLLQPE